MVARHGENPDPDYYLMFPGHRLEIDDCLIGSLAKIMYQKDGNSGLPAGYTYLGQFIAHDITHFFDSSNKSLARQFTEQEQYNLRTPSLDLDSLYGHPSEFGPHIPSRDGKFINNSEYDYNGRSLFYDLPRADDGLAHIGDERNDENMFLAQVHLLFMNAHNRLFDLYRAAGESNPFKKARQELTLTFQRLVLDDFLRRLLNPLVYNKLFESSGSLTLLDVQPGQKIKIPHEFSAAAFRFGHSLVRGSYKISYQGEHEPQNVSRIFELTRAGGKWQEVHPDRFSMAWSAQVDLSRYGVKDDWQPAEKIDSFLIAEMRDLMVEPPSDNNVIVRNLKKGRELGLGSGQSIIDAIRATANGESYCEQMELDVLDFSKIRSNKMQDLLDRFSLRKNMPLWTYILLEPAQYYPGRLAHRKLGSLGSILVGEVLRALILTSRTSALQSNFDFSKGQFFKDLQSRFPDRSNSGDEIGFDDLVAFVHL
jgi:hypothetical protein